MRLRRWLLLVLVLAAAAVLGLAGLVWMVGKTGRAPGELIDYTERRLQGHPKLEFVALPVLEQLRQVLGEPDEIDHRLPFFVPALPPNPRRQAVDETPAVQPGVIRVGPTRELRTVAQAARKAVNGSVIEIDAGDYPGDVVVWTQRGLTIRGRGEQVRIIAAGAHAEGKALWVMRGDRITVEGVQFIGSRVPDGNGAGIRLEAGRLVVRRCAFFDNQMGILTTNDGRAELEVHDSEFGWHHGNAGISHALYVGSIARLHLSGSWIHHVNRGHLVKSRARFNRIAYNRLSDESGGQASYELELPNGGEAEVVGNLVQQGAGTRNSVMVSYGIEGLRWPLNTLLFAHNTVVNDRRHGGTFLRVVPGTASVVLRNNLWVGPGRVDVPAGADAAGDRRATWEDLVRPAREDWRLSERGRQRLADPPPASVPAPGLPEREYRHPLSTTALSELPRWPGALQTP